MNGLFKLGYDLAAKGYPWSKTPPGFSLPESGTKTSTQNNKTKQFAGLRTSEHGGW